MTNNSWQTKKLGNITVINGGGTPPTSHTEYFNGNVPWFTPSEITSGTVSILTDSRRQITEEATKFSKVAEQGTVLLSSRATIGNIGIVSNRSTYNQGIKGISPKKELNPWFLAYWLLANKKILEKSSFGTTFKELSTTALKRFDITIPSIPIQQQIVGKLDAIKKLQELNQKEIEKAEELFNSYLSKYSKISTGKQTKTIGELVEVITKGTTPTTYGHSFANKGVPFLRVENIRNDAVNPLDTTHYIDATTNKLLDRSRTKPNDILVTIAGTIGRIGYVPNNAPEMNMNQAVAVIRTNPELLNYLYLFYLLQTKELQNQMSGARVTGTITNISLTTIKNLKIFCPSVKEQIQVAEKLNEIMLYKKLLITRDVETNNFFESALNKLLRPNYETKL